MLHHTRWLQDRLESVAGVTGVFVTTTGFDYTQDVSSRTPYIVIHPSDGPDRAERLTGPGHVFNPSFVVHAVSTDAFEAQAVGDDIKAVLVSGGFGVQPNVPGERSRSIQYEVASSLLVDTDTTPWLVSHVADVNWSAETI